MAISAIDPRLAKQGGGAKPPVTGGVGFTDVLAAATPGTTAAVGVANRNNPNFAYQASTATQAAMSTAAGLPNALSTNAGNAPYSTPVLGTNVTPGGYNYAGVPSGSGYAGGTGLAGAYGAPGTTAVAGGVSSEAQDRAQFMQVMSSQNWQMLKDQIEVNRITTAYTAASNIEQANNQAKKNAVGNMRA